MFDLEMVPAFKAEANILVIGTGDAGCRALNHLINEGLSQVSYLGVNSDRFALESCLAQRKILLGEKTVRGLGCGSDTSVAYTAFKENLCDFDLLFREYDMVFVLTGLGGGTGTVAAPMIAKEAKKQGALTVVLASLPFDFEGSVRKQQAEEGLKELHGVGDSLIVVDNEKALTQAHKEQPIGQTFARLNERFLHSVRGITSLVTQRRYGRGVQEITRVDFNDIKTIMQDRSRSLIGFGFSDAVESCGPLAVENALAELMQGNHTLAGAQGLLVSFSSGPDISIVDVELAVQRFRDEIGSDVDTNVIYGVTTDESMEHSMEIMVIATGVAHPYSENREPVFESRPQPVVQKSSEYEVYTNHLWQDPAAEPAHYRKHIYEQKQPRKDKSATSSASRYLDWMITPSGHMHGEQS